MKAEIISIGTELLLGQIVDTNAAYIAQKLAELGIDVYYKSTVGDNKARMKTIFKTSLDRADIIITTGGLGPTDDDLTREVIAEIMEVKLVKDDNLAQEIESFFDKLGRKMTANNLKQAYLPQGAEAIVNDWGTAPGILMEQQDKLIFSTPGVPREMKGLMEGSIIPYLRERVASQQLIKSRVLRVCGYGESTLETKIKDILEEQSNPTIALLAGDSQVKLRLTAKAQNEEEAKELIDKEEKRLRARLGEAIFGIDEDTMEGVVAALLKDKGLSLALAESCTGGLISHRLTNIPGSSAYLDRNVVAYSYGAKEELLQVSSETLKKEGAVSAEVAEEMALGIRELAGTDLGLSVTGIAGPTGGNAQKPIGLVYMALAEPGGVNSYRLKFQGSRKQIKWLTSQYVLDKLRSYLNNLELS